MKTTLIAALVAMWTGRVHADPPAPMPHEDRLTCELAAPASVNHGDPIPVTFTLRNTSNETLQVLKWYTPLEGLRGSIFVVKRDGVEVPYLGLSAKRGRPSAGAYVTIVPGQATMASVDLARRGYGITAPGSYAIAFRGVLSDVYAGGLEEKRTGQRMVTVSCNAVTVTVR